MKTFSFSDVTLTSGHLFEKQELNRNTTVFAVYDRFFETGRISAFDFGYDPEVEGSVKPHYYWDSDVAKWIEGVAYILKHHPEMTELEARADAIIENVKRHQRDDGYFNIYHMQCEPESIFKKRHNHELYCAGHLMEAAVAYADATGKTTLLECMEKYAEYIYKVFVVDKSAEFFSPGHEEIELALVRMYRYTGKKMYLDLAAHFINVRGKNPEDVSVHPMYTQDQAPVREQTEAVGHAVRAVYLYTGMAYLAAETGERELADACRTLWNDIVRNKMYVTGGIGSTKIGEAFTRAYDLPNDTAYAETCAAIGLVFFANSMLALENKAEYADVAERALYNGVLSGLSLDGRAFFYTNPLEINLSEHWEKGTQRRDFPITQRPAMFGCSCCPPNINRLLPSLGNYIYGEDDGVLYVNQFVSSELSTDTVKCTQDTDYPNSGNITLRVDGARAVAIRIPSWCDSFRINREYRMENGYAIIENSGEIEVELDVAPRLVYADSRIIRATGRVCVMKGPVVYCAEGVDNGADLHSYAVPENAAFTEAFDKELGLCTLEMSCAKRKEFEGSLYSNKAPTEEPAKLKLIPYNAFANRGETDMIVWFNRSYASF